MALGVESEFVGQQLKNAGVYGAIISVLLSTIGGLILYIRSLHKSAARIYGYRLAERDAYNTALNDSKNAILTQADISRERNKVIEDLAKAIAVSSAQGATLNALLQLQFEVIKEDHARESQVLSSMAEAVRNLAASASTIQSGVNSLPQMLQSLQQHIDTILPRRNQR